ncbi:dTDP-4-dehydrorhamnose 3,5-epimerase family protein [Streptomyces flavofungini]|uniref:dTDP-4-dehydrorhamnose 3,5-epimerase family protein n=1 Tax=Streptomyces flavofungini TaxID=68200 RepID=UPI0034DE4797
MRPRPAPALRPVRRSPSPWNVWPGHASTHFQPLSSKTPTYQDEDSGIAVYLSEGLGHAFLTLTDDACMNYLCSEAYVPGTMIEVNPLGLKEAADSGLLPTYEACLAHYDALKRGRG